jgi:hypothetical protein
MKRTKLGILMVLVLVVLAACATLQDTWNKATPQEKTRIVVYDLQVGLKGTLKAGAMYVDLHPDKRADWKVKVLPIAELCNKALLDAATEGMTYDMIAAKASVYMMDITAILTAWGVAKADIETQKAVVRKAGVK